MHKTRLRQQEGFMLFLAFRGRFALFQPRFAFSKVREEDGKPEKGKANGVR